MRDQAPDQSGDEEAVVQPLIRGEIRRGVRELLRQPEGSPPERFGPEEHLEDEEQEVQQGDEADQDVGQDAHRATASMVRRTRASPRAMSSGETAPALRRNQPVSCCSPKAWNGTTAKPASSSNRRRMSSFVRMGRLP